MTTPRPLALDVYGITASVTSPSDAFLDFVGKNYSTFLSPTPPADCPRLTIDFSEEAGAHARSLKPTLSSAGEGIHFSDDHLYWENEFGFAVAVDLSDRASWSISGFHFDLLTCGAGEEQYKNYQRSMRWMVHFPIFCLLQVEQNKHLIHASAVSSDQKSLVFFGLNKVGKSSLALYLMDRLGYNFITDNFLLYDDQYLYPFPERGRVSSESRSRLNLSVPMDGQTVYGKHHIDLPQDRIAPRGRPTAAFFVSFGDTLSIDALERSRATGLIQGLHHVLAEFPAYSFYSMLPYYGIGTGAQLFDETLWQSVPFFRLTHPRTWDIQSTVDEVMRHVH